MMKFFMYLAKDCSPKCNRSPETFRYHEPYQTCWKNESYRFFQDLLDGFSLTFRKIFVMKVYNQLLFFNIATRFVPQGLMSESLLLLMYVNSMSWSVTCNYELYIDNAWPLFQPMNVSEINQLKGIFIR